MEWQLLGKGARLLCHIGDGGVMLGVGRLSTSQSSHPGILSGRVDKAFW